MLFLKSFGRRDIMWAKLTEDTLPPGLSALGISQDESLSFVVPNIHVKIHWNPLNGLGGDVLTT